MLQIYKKPYMDEPEGPNMKKKKTCRKLPLARCVLFTFKHAYHLQKHKIIKSS
jgi:hypothetical protein